MKKNVPANIISSAPFIKGRITDFSKHTPTINQKELKTRQAKREEFLQFKNSKPLMDTIAELKSKINPYNSKKQKESRCIERYLVNTFKSRALVREF